jgi:polysaccharide pyruvyl transferase WcaK-like protein
MHLGIVGWYGHNNFGDERILFCIQKFFAGNQFYVADNIRDPKLNDCDFILVGGGGLILRNTAKLVDSIQKIEKPFGFIGVGVETKHRSMKDYFDIIKKRAEFIMVRDQQSKKNLDYHYKVIVGNDLTFLYPYHTVEEVENEICGLNLRHWYYWKAELDGTYYRLIRRLNRFSFMKKVYPFGKWKEEKLVKIVKSKFKKIVAVPLYSKQSESALLITDIELLSKYFEIIPSEFDISLYHRIRFIVGMRFHSIIFATQCGIPFLSLSYQPKNHNFCADLGLKELSVSLYKLDELNDKICYLKSNYGKIRNKLITYTKECNLDLQKTFEKIYRLIKSY